MVQMQSWLLLCCVCPSIFAQISQGISENFPNRTYPNFSNLEEENTTAKNPPAKNPPPSSSPQCTIYNSQNYKNLDVYQKCLKAADKKSSVGNVACETAKKISEILKDCIKIDEFEKKFIENTKENITQLKNTDGWDIYGTGVAFEPYTFPGVQLYIPYQTNKKFDEIGEFSNLIDSYNYYTECETVFGDSCTWYHQAKIITYYQQKGGVWMTERRNFYQEQTMWAFYTPVLVDSRFYGVIAMDTIQP